MKISKEEAIKILSRYDTEYYTPATREAHRMGIEALREQEERRWIPVTERLPDGECIALGYQNEMLIGYIGDSEYSDTGYAAESDGEHLSDVTHWMPLPDTPKEGDG